MQLPDNFDYGEFRKRDQMEKKSELRRPSAPLNDSFKGKFLSPFGKRFDSILNSIPESDHGETVDYTEDPNSIHSLHTRLNSELDCSIDLLSNLEERIAWAISKRSGLIKSILNFGQLSILREMHKKYLEISRDLLTLKQTLEEQITIIATVGGLHLSVDEISRQFQTFRATRIEKELRAFEKEFSSGK